MNITKDLAVYRILLILLISLAEGYFGRPHNHGIGKKREIIKRVEISGTGSLRASQVASRRQNVIHAGQDYDSDDDNRKPVEDELENLGKVVDYDGKLIETSKPGASKWKDTAAISKDVIERIKEIQESLIKRSGGKNLEEKLELLQPEKNVTVATGESNGVTSRKIIPEDVVNKIIEKFQELRSQAKELAKLDQREKGKEAENPHMKVEGEGKDQSEKTKDNKEVKDENKDQNKPMKFFSPYESIGPPKENEEMKNITQHTVSESTGNMPGNQEIFKSSTSGPVEAEHSRQQNYMMQDQMQKSNMFQQQQQQQNMNMMQQNMPGNMMMMPGKVPMMFIKSGEMLVPVFGGQTGPSYGYPNGYDDRRGLDGQSGGSFIQAQQRMIPALMPQHSMIENGQSRSGPPSTNMGSANGVEIPSVPYSLIMSLMSAPGIAQNFPASQPQINTGAFNMPQINAANIVQPSPSAAFGLPHGDTTGFSRSFQSSNEAMVPVLNQQGIPVGPTASSMLNEQPTGFMGGGLGQESQMAISRGVGPVGVSMDLSGGLSPVNSMNSAFMQQPNMGPLAFNPFQNSQAGMEFVNREKQMLNPSMVNPVNDLSDPMEGPSPPGLRNVSPDQLLELAKARSNDEENPEVGEMRTIQRDPDSLLDTLHKTQLNRDLSGPGDPEKSAMRSNFVGMGNNAVSDNSPYAEANPETLLDMLSKRKSNNVGNREVMDWEQSQQNKLFSDFKNENEAFGRGQVTPIGTNGMQSISSLPTAGALDPSFADLVGNQPFGNANQNSATENPVESSFFRPGKNQFSRGPNSISVMSQDDLRYEHSRNAIDSGGGSPINQADVYVRHKIMDPSKIADKRSRTPLLKDDNIELKVNGKPMAETASLRSKIVNGKIQKGHGKTLTSKSPVRIELSHSHDAKKTKVINIVTTGKFDVKESRRDKISKKGNKKGNIIKTFYGSSS